MQLFYGIIVIAIMRERMTIQERKRNSDTVQKLLDRDGKTEDWARTQYPEEDE